MQQNLCLFSTPDIQTGKKKSAAYVIGFFTGKYMKCGKLV